MCSFRWEVVNGAAEITSSRSSNLSCQGSQQLGEEYNATMLRLFTILVLVAASVGVEACIYEYGTIHETQVILAAESGQKCVPSAQSGVHFYVCSN